MLVRFQDRIVNLSEIKKISVEDVNLHDVYESADDLARAIMAIQILIETENSVEKLMCHLCADEEDSKLESMESTKEKVKEYALRRLTEIFGAKDLTSI